MYRDRRDAARKLADALRPYEESIPVVLAIPRGAVEMGAILAEELGGDLNVVLVKKIRAPGNSEFAIGAVTESGRIYRSEEVDEVVCLEQPGILYGISQGYEQFPQVRDDRVVELLESAHNQTPSAHE